MPFHYRPIRRGRDSHPRNPALQAGVLAARPPRRMRKRWDSNPDRTVLETGMPLRTSLPKISGNRGHGRGSQMGCAEEGRVELPPAGRPGQVSNPLRRTDIRLSSTQTGARGRNRTCGARRAPVLQTGVPPWDFTSLAAPQGFEPRLPGSEPGVLPATPQGNCGDRTRTRMSGAKGRRPTVGRPRRNRKDALPAAGSGSVRAAGLEPAPVSLRGCGSAARAPRAYGVPARNRTWT